VDYANSNMFDENKKKKKKKNKEKAKTAIPRQQSIRHLVQFSDVHFDQYYAQVGWKLLLLLLLLSL
jgi:hypothetical protein